jgi:hypothetical protein
MVAGAFFMTVLSLGSIGTIASRFHQGPRLYHHQGRQRHIQIRLSLNSSFQQLSGRSITTHVECASSGRASYHAQINKKGIIFPRESAVLRFFSATRPRQAPLADHVHP